MGTACLWRPGYGRLIEGRLAKPQGALACSAQIAGLATDYFVTGAVRYKSSAVWTLLSSQILLGPAERIMTSLSEK